MYIHNNTSYEDCVESYYINSHVSHLLSRYIHMCHTTVSTQCLPHWFDHLHWNMPQYNTSNKRAPGQSSSEGVYCSLSLSGLAIEPQKHRLHFSRRCGFFCLHPLFFTKAILDKERAWKKQITLPHTGLLYQCSMSTVLPVEYINVCSWAL